MDIKPAIPIFGVIYMLLVLFDIIEFKSHNIVTYMKTWQMMIFTIYHSMFIYFLLTSLKIV